MSDEAYQGEHFNTEAAKAWRRGDPRPDPEYWRRAQLIELASLRAENARLKAEVSARLSRAHAALLVFGAVVLGGIASSILLVMFHG